MNEAMQVGFAEHTMFILLALAVAFGLGLLLGYILWYSYKKMVDGLRMDNEKLHAKHVDLEKDYVSLKYKHDESTKDNAALKSSLANCEADKAILQNKLEAATATENSGAEAPAMSAGYGAIFSADNLQIIEGIGPKVEQALKSAGISTWSDLSAKTPEELRSVLDNAEGNFQISNPATWPSQASYAAAGQWDELVHYQKFLDGGREDTGDGETDSKIEKMAMKKSEAAGDAES